MFRGLQNIVFRIPPDLYSANNESELGPDANLFSVQLLAMTKNLTTDYYFVQKEMEL